MNEPDDLTAADIDQIIEGIEYFIIEGYPEVDRVWQPYIAKLEQLKARLFAHSETA
jgi:hypothetical protein